MRDRFIFLAEKRRIDRLRAEPSNERLLVGECALQLPVLRQLCRRLRVLAQLFILAAQLCNSILCLAQNVLIERLYFF